MKKLSLSIFCFHALFAQVEELASLSVSLHNLSAHAGPLCMQTLVKVVEKPDQVAYQSNGVLLRVIIADIVSVPADAVVNAANQGCLGGGGIDGYISKMGGPALLQARQKLPVVNGVRCPAYQARITRSGLLFKKGLKYVVHAVGPICKEDHMTQQQKNDLAATYVNTLKRISAFNQNPKNSVYPEFALVPIATLPDYKISRVNFPAISTGIFGCTTDQSARSVLVAILDLLNTQCLCGIKEINFVFFNPADQQKARDDFNEYKKVLDGCSKEELQVPGSHQEKVVVIEPSRHAPSEQTPSGCILF